MVGLAMTFLIIPAYAIFEFRWGVRPMLPLMIEFPGWDLVAFGVFTVFGPLVVLAFVLRRAARRRIVLTPDSLRLEGAWGAYDLPWSGIDAIERVGWVYAGWLRVRSRSPQSRWEC